MVHGSSKEWWKHRSDLGECPITLEPLSTLPYPPFLLRRNYFDGFALASFIVSRGAFQNPLTREELTLEECRRLDDYLEDFCYNDDSNNFLVRGSTRQKVSVTEAFALRNSVHVQTSSSGASAEALRNAATSALVGLFVYGNDRRQQDHSDGAVRQQGGQQQEQNIDPFLMDWGFDLSRTVENTAELGGHGYTVIDDDEANVVASQQFSYQAVQEAFPPLHDNIAGNTTLTAGRPDDGFLERIRSLSVQDQQTHQQRLRRMRIAREQLLREALNRRDERRRQRQLERARNAEKNEQEKQEKAEIEEARAEIEAWREEQWEKLRLLSEQQHQQIQGCGDTKKEETVPARSATGNDNANSKESESSEMTNEEELAVQKKKAMAAAKRKRAKERKKNQKAVERERRELEEQRKALGKQKEASNIKCNACGTGILDCGFERFGKLFCSPKCARSVGTPA